MIERLWERGVITGEPMRKVYLCCRVCDSKAMIGRSMDGIVWDGFKTDVGAFIVQHSACWHGDLPRPLEQPFSLFYESEKEQTPATVEPLPMTDEQLEYVRMLKERRDAAPS